MKKSFKRIVRTHLLYKLYAIDERGFQAALPFQFKNKIHFFMRIKFSLSMSFSTYFSMS